MPIADVAFANASSTVISAEIDGVLFSIPDDPSNLQRRALAEWEAAGGAIAPYSEPPAARRSVAKHVIINRLTDGQLDAALALMSPRQKERWRSPGHPSVYADDPETVGMLQAIGADPATVLAPD